MDAGAQLDLICGGCRDLAMRAVTEPTVKRVVAFFDGRNLRKSARSAFGNREYENIHPLKIARMVCARQGWQL